MVNLLSVRLGGSTTVNFTSQGVVIWGKDLAKVIWLMVNLI